jgi:hypothetical protein
VKGKLKMSLEMEKRKKELCFEREEEILDSVMRKERERKSSVWREIWSPVAKYPISLIQTFNAPLEYGSVELNADGGSD